jgi:uncharacterized protein (TIGR00369 family)
MHRSRTYGWADPTSLAAGAASTDGLEFSHRLAVAQDGLTPIFATLGYRLAEVDEGRAVYIGEPGEHLLGPLGVVDGGYAATMLDSAAATAIHSTIPAGTGYTTMGHTVRFLRPVETTGTIHAVGRVINRGRTSALAQVELRDSADRLLAVATNTCIILEPHPGRP